VTEIEALTAQRDALHIELAAANQRALMAQLDDSKRDELAALRIDLEQAAKVAEQLRADAAKLTDLLKSSSEEELRIHGLASLTALDCARESLGETEAELAAAEHLQEVTQAEYSRGITHATEQIRSLEAQWAEETDLRRRAESERDSARTQVHNLSARIEAVRLATGQSEFDSRTEASYVATLRAERDVAVSEARALRQQLSDAAALFAKLSAAGISHGGCAEGIIEAFRSPSREAEHRAALLRFGKQVVDYIVTPPLGVWLECHGNPATVARRLDLAALLLKVAP